MSLVIAFALADYAQIVVDTRANAEDGSAHYLSVSKLRMLNALPAIFATCGHTSVSAAIAAGIYQRCHLDFDGLAEALPGIIEWQLSGGLMGEERRDELPAWIFQFGVTIAGWSPKAQRIVLHRFDKAARDAPVTAMLDTQNAIGPAVDVSPDLSFVDIARRQRDWCAEHAPHILPGGKLVMGQVTRETIQVETIGTLEP